jgi:hypothetical protein
MRVGNPQTLNRYGYVVNNPTNRVDPRGLCGELMFMTRSAPAPRFGSFTAGFGGPEDTDAYITSLGQDDCAGVGGGGGGGGVGSVGDFGGGVPLDALAGDPMGAGLPSIAVPGGSNTSVNNLYPDLPSTSADVSVPTVATEALPIGSTSYDFADLFQPMAPVIVQGAGVVGDPKYVGGFLVTSAVLGATASAGAIAEAGAGAYETGAGVYNEGMSRIIQWQAGDAEGFMTTQDMIYNIINADVVPEGTSQGAIFGAFVGCYLFGTENGCPGVLRPDH